MTASGEAAKQMDLGEGWKHVVQGGVSSRLPLHSLFQITVTSWSRKLPSNLSDRHLEGGQASEV
jgi:hypothetical protein